MPLLDLQVIYFCAVVTLVLFAVIGVFDGVYYHLYRYNLQSHPEARLEHWIHTGRAFVFSGFAFLLYVINSGGILLWVAVVLIALDVVLEIVDILVEKEARAKLGGISSGESLVHVLATACKSVSLALVLIAKPVSAWTFSSPSVLGSYPLYVILAGTIFTVSTLVGGIGQIALMKPVPRSHQSKSSLLVGKA